MSKKAAQKEALRLAVEKLKHIDLTVRCPSLGLPSPENGTLHFRAFGKDLILRQPDFQLIKAETGEPAKLSDRVLVLHYLLYDSPLTLTNESISFKGFPEGQFYWQPFLSRTVNPLLGRIGNDLELLRTHLQRFDWEEVDLGDFGARIHAIGKLYVTLVYHLGDDEFPPAADVLFDACIKQVFVAEDVAVLASRICLGLL
jgi:hypothetical protein